MKYMIRFRSSMSARALAGRVKRKNGSDATVNMSEINSAELVIMCIVQVAAVSCAATQVPEMRVANQSFRKTGFRSAIQVEVLVIRKKDWILGNVFSHPSFIGKGKCVGSIH